MGDGSSSSRREMTASTAGSSFTMVFFLRESESPFGLPLGCSALPTAVALSCLTRSSLAADVVVVVVVGLVSASCAPAPVVMNRR
jgi:hypothetical protein